LFWTEVALRGANIGSQKRVLAVVRDITERKRTEGRLHLLREALESAANAIVITDRQGAIIWVNRAFSQLTGYSLREALGRKTSLLKSAVHDEAFYRKLWETVLAGRVWSAEMTNRRKDGTLYTEENSITPVRDEKGEVTHFVAIKQDVTERRRAQEAQRESEENYRALVELSPDAIFLHCEAKFVYANPAALKLLGADQPEQLLERSVFDIVPPEHQDAIRQRIQHAAEGDLTPPLDQWIIRLDGTAVEVEGTSLPFMFKGKPAVQSVMRGITERKQLEQQLRQAQKMEAVGQLAGGVAHDFNNMLAVIRGNAELLLMDANEYTPRTKDCLKQISAASERAANLTRQLLAFSRKQVMQSRPLNLNEVIADLTKMLKRVIGEHIDLQCCYGAQLTFVQADAGMIEQVLLNLAINARDAMPRGGQLLISSEAVCFDGGQPLTHPEARAGQFVCLTVKDAGTGIAPEHLPRIFEPFFTTKEIGKGTGLGLATVYGIVQQHQGWIEVFSQPGAGTTFKIFLPAIPPPAGASAAPQADGDLPGGSETILLVEDEYAVRMITRRMLESHGYKVYEATTAMEGLGVWRNQAEEIGLLLTDIVMPQGITGRDLAEQLRASRPRLKVILMSGYSADVVGKDTEFFRRTKTYFIQKPCSARVLLETVRACLDAK
jgi:nitrogen fixation negative regulator NifL